MLSETELSIYSRMPISSWMATFGSSEISEPNWYLPERNNTVRMVFHAHMHNEIEIHQIRSGTLYAEISGKSYTLNPGDILIINPYELHQGVIPIDGVTSYTCVVFDPCYFSGCCGMAGEDVRRISAGELQFPTVIDAHAPIAAELGTILDDIHTSYTGAVCGGSGEDCMLTAAVVRLLGTLLQKIPMFTGGDAVERRIRFIHSIQPYVEQYFRSNLTTERIASSLGYNKSYFCTLFKQNFGMSFLQYLNERRIQYAMIWYKDRPLTQIAEAIGFTDYSYFARVFKKHTGMTPREYFSNQ